MTSDISVIRIGSRIDLAALEPEWERLLERTDVASPFLTPGWQQAWLDTFGRRHRLFVLTARQRDELVGLWPLGVRTRFFFRVLEPIGAGRSDWLDVPILPERRSAVMSAFVRYLNDHRGEWDLLDARDVLTDSPTSAELTTLCREEGVRIRRSDRTVAPYLALRGSWEEFLGTKRAKFRSNLRYYRRLPERDGKRLEIRRVAWTDRDDLIEKLATIERGSWKARDGNLKISTAAGREFYRRFCSYFASRDCLDLWTAEIDGAPVAFILNIVYGGKVYHYNTSYLENSANISPGVLLHADAISNAFERKLAEYDFLSGNEPYKERWCSNQRSIEHLTLHHRGRISVLAQKSLVEMRWAARRSPSLVSGRRALLEAARRIRRRTA